MQVTKVESLSKVSEFQHKTNQKKPRYLHMIRSRLVSNLDKTKPENQSKYADNEKPFPEVISEIKTYLRRKKREARIRESILNYDPLSQH